MLIDSELQKLFRELSGERTVSFNYDGIPLKMSGFNQGSHFELSTTVYEGGNYIPASVRKCITTLAFPSPIQTHLNVDEDHFQISLHYTGNSNNLNDIRFHNLLDEFNVLVDKWRLKLDENDKNDLVHVHVK